MALVEERPTQLAADPSEMRVVRFVSPADGCRVGADVYSPPRRGGAALPLLLAPHAIMWTADQDYHGGILGLKRKYHAGYYGLSAKYRVIVAMPHGHEHREPLCSLAGPAQVDDMVSLIDVLGEHGYSVDGRRVYTCGLSMGAQEALVCAGRHPDRIAAVCAFNPIVDLAAWYEDLEASELPEIRAYDTARRIANEVGGRPEQVPGAYLERSPTHYVDGLSAVPTIVYWSDRDLVVPRQLTHHAYRLYQQVKQANACSPFAEYNHTLIHGVREFDTTSRWQLHEWCDYELALRWLLCHER